VNPSRIVALLDSRAATLGSSKLLCVDGPAGSGKTTLAGAVAELTGAPVVRMDDLYDGWAGLLDVDPHVLGILDPLGADRPGHYRRYDWIAGGYAEEHAVAPAPLLILEGVAAGNRAWASRTTALVWVETDEETRIARGLARDGEAVREHWRAWMDQERKLYTRERTRERADLVVTT
jgi:uridine kinase